MATSRRLIAEQVDWARACGFDVVAAGKGTKYLPAYHQSTPDTVWGHYGLTAEQARHRRHEPADVQLLPRRHQVGDRDGGGRQRHRPDAGAGRARFPALRRRRSAARAAARRPRAASSITRARSKSSPRWSATAGRCSAICAGASMWCSRRRRTMSRAASPSTAWSPIRSGRYTALYKPYHLIGLELGISVASAGLRGEADRRAHRLPRRRRRHRQARPRRRRDARRRRRLHRLGQTDARRRQPARRRPADRPRASRQAARRGESGCVR